MDGHPSTPTDWEMWEGVQSKLDKKRRRFLLPIWLWIPMIGLFFGGMGYWIGNYNMEPSNMISNIQMDTVVVEKFVTQTDTIFKDRIVTQWRTKPATGLIAQNDMLRSQSNDLALANKAYQESIDLYRKAIVDAGLDGDVGFRSLPDLQQWIAENPGVLRDDEERISQRLEELASVPSLEMNHPFEDKMKPPILSRFVSNEYLHSMQKPPSFLQQITPDYCNIGLTVDAPLISYNQDGAFGVEFGGGANVALLFSRRFSIWTGIRIRNNNTTVSDEQLAMGYPQPMIPVGDEFKKLSIISNYTDIPLEARYKLKVNQRYTPYLMVGGSISIPTKAEYKYEYSTLGSEVYYEVSNDDAKPSFGYALLGYGIESNPRARVNLFGEAFLRYDLKNQSSILDNYHGLGLRLGLMYQL